MIFNNKNYSLNQLNDLFEFCDKSEVGQYMHYYDKLVFHAEEGFIAAYYDDLENFWFI